MYLIILITEFFMKYLFIIAFLVLNLFYVPSLFSTPACENCDISQCNSNLIDEDIHNIQVVGLVDQKLRFW